MCAARARARPSPGDSRATRVAPSSAGARGVWCASTRQMGLTSTPDRPQFGSKVAPHRHDQSTSSWSQVDPKSTPNGPQIKPSRPHMNPKPTLVSTARPNSTEPHRDDPKATPRHPPEPTPHIDPNATRSGPRPTPKRPHIDPKARLDDPTSTPHGLDIDRKAIDTKLIPCRPQIGAQRPQIDPASMTGRPNVDDRSTQNRPTRDAHAVASPGGEGQAILGPAIFVCVPNSDNGSSGIP